MKEDLKNFYKDLTKRDQQTTALSEDAKLRVKNNIFSNLGMQVTAGPISTWSKLTSNKFSHIFFKGYVLAPLLVILFITGTTIASANALPGDTLYPVKRQVENARLLIAPTEEAKINLEVNFAQERLNEAEKVNVNSQIATQADDNNKDNTADDNHKNNDEANKNTKDSDNSNGSNSNQTATQMNQNNPNIQSKRQMQAREEADKALDFLNKTKKDWQEKGKNQQAQQIEDNIKKFRSNIENRFNIERDRSGDDSSGDDNQDSSHGGDDNSDSH